MFWYRAWLAFGRPWLLGTTVKDWAKIPTNLVADEKVTGVAGQEVSVPTPLGAGCFLGVSVVATTDTTTSKAGYGEFAAALSEDHAGAMLSALDPQDQGSLATGALRHPVLERAGQVYQAATKRQFAQRLRRLGEWTQRHLSGAVAERVGKRCRRRVDFIPAYDCPQAHRTSNAVERLLNYPDRLLYAMRYCHATTARARLAVRAMALQWNFHP